MLIMRITDENFNKLTIEDLKRLVLTNDDASWNWDDILKCVKESESYKEPISNVEILDLFYEMIDDSYCSNLIYFDGEMKDLCFI